MSTSLFIGPINPYAWGDAPADEKPSDRSDLKIDVDAYYSEFQKKWPFANISYERSEHYVLFWNLIRQGEAAGPEGGMQSDLEHVSFGYGQDVCEFVLWHRELIPDRYTLYLFNSISFPEHLVLTPHITAEEVQSYLENS